MNNVWLLIFLPFVLYGCSLYDLRPETTRDKASETEESKKRAFEIISQSAHVHGWDSLGERNIIATYTDEWPGFMLNTFFRPWPSSSKLLEHHFGSRDLYTSKVVMLDGKKKGEVWGLESKQAYKIIDGKKKNIKDKDITFYLPAYQYFIEMGLWASDVPELLYAGQQKIKNKNYHVIYGTWNTYDPQKDVDQYLFYIDKETLRLEIVAYTLRDVMANAHGANWFSDFREVDGLLIPYKQTVTGGVEDEKIVHEITMKNFEVR